MNKIKSNQALTLLTLPEAESSLMPVTTRIQSPAAGMYNTRSAITKPTLKNKLLAGRKGMMASAKLINIHLKYKYIYLIKS